MQALVLHIGERQAAVDLRARNVEQLDKLTRRAEATRIHNSGVDGDQSLCARRGNRPLETRPRICRVAMDIHSQGTKYF